MGVAKYVELVRCEITRAVDVREEIGLDVIVRGELKRNDVVQYFGENSEGFACTRNSWIPSNGTRCTRPSLLWGDPSRRKLISTYRLTHAQSAAVYPVFGMLGAAVTILAWSLVRDDHSLGKTARQVALVLRGELADLQAGGILVVRVDGPALRELLTLKGKDQSSYLERLVGSSRPVTSGMRDETQIRTHLCWSDFVIVIDTIGNLDAGVTIIQAARSGLAVTKDIRTSGFDHSIGPGVYDIHSPRVPSLAQVTEISERALGSITARQLRVNSQCALKARGHAETVESLQNVFAATRAERARPGPSRSWTPT